MRLLRPWVLLLSIWMVVGGIVTSTPGPLILTATDTTSSEPAVRIRVRRAFVETRPRTAESRESKAESRQPKADASAGQVDEMVRNASGHSERWTAAPELLVIADVLDYDAAGDGVYRATSDRLSEDEIDALVDDLTRALRLFTDETFDSFRAVRVESVGRGEVVNVIRPDHIVVARYRGLNTIEHTIGFGGRRVRRDGAIVSGSVMLDSEFDRGSRRGLLRMHEFGHAMGFNHVVARPSIMNPRIGTELNTVDRQIARQAYRPPTNER